MERITILRKTDKLYNAILPIFLFEAWYILLALLIVVIVEAFIVSKILNLTFAKSFKYLLLVNIFTTFLGFILQGILRIMILMVIRTDGESKIINILLGNYGVDKSNFTLEIVLELLISLSITFALSVYYEYKSLEKILADIKPKKLIFKSIFIANAVSYILIFIYLLLCLK